MSVQTIEQLSVYGPDRCEVLSVEQARAWCRRLSLRRYENFSVLSRLVPKALRDDFAAVYAFCRWADDLGDEAGGRDRATELLAWWRRELEQCFEGEPRHPVFIALEPTIRRHDLPIGPFGDLITAFERDQRMTRYETWADLLEYCRYSANPVGRLVLMLGGEPRSEAVFARSDDICTALQLTNHWQDIRRDILERDRIYVPRELITIDRFEERLVASARQGYGVDQAFLGESRTLVRTCVERTWPLYESGEALLAMTSATTRPIVWLLAAGGRHVLHMIETWDYETTLHRPKLGAISRALLVGRAWWRSAFAGSGAVPA
jgi:squalene synthase HpnC